MPTETAPAVSLTWEDLKRINRLLWWVAGGTLVAHLLVVAIEYLAGFDHALGLVPLFNLYYEGNVPTFFSALILLLTGVLVLQANRTGGLPAASLRRHWNLLGFGFLAMAADEATDARMVLRDLMRSVFDREDLAETLPGFYSDWTVPMVGLLIILLAAFLPFLRRLPQRFLVRALGAGLCYVGAAVGLENLQFYWVAVTGEGGPVFMALVTAEEMIEITSILYFQWALLDELQRSASDASRSSPA